MKIDEVNNSLYYTYNLHKQDFPLIIKGPVERDIFRKDIRAVRGILSTLSRTQYRSDIKQSLKSGWNKRMNYPDLHAEVGVFFAINNKRTFKEINKIIKERER